MDLLDISLWASDRVRIIEVLPVFANAPFKLKVGKFVPPEGDLIQEVWSDEKGMIRKHEIPPYAIANTEESAISFQDYIDSAIGECIIADIGDWDSLLWSTYLMAFKHSTKAIVSQRMDLLKDGQSLLIYMVQADNERALV